MNNDNMQMNVKADLTDILKKGKLSNYKSLPFADQKISFYTTKGDLLESKKPPHFKHLIIKPL